MNLASNQPLHGYLSTKQAAAYLGISQKWLASLRQIGGGPEYHKLSRYKVTYTIRDLDAWAMQFRRRNTSEEGRSTIQGGK